MQEITPKQIGEWLSEVKDPEIPALSIVDLGVITGIEVEDAAVKIRMTPTFVGCPALDTMKHEIHEVLTRKGVTTIVIEVSFNPPWTSDRISPSGRQALRNFGIAPPPSGTLFTELDILGQAECPRCGSNDTHLRNTFGPTLCRAIYYCNNCREAFEQFKPL